MKLLECVALQDDGEPRKREALMQTVTRMLDAPQGRKLARSYIEEGGMGTIRFMPFSGVQLGLDTDGRLIDSAKGYSACADDGRVTVTLNEAYLAADINWRTTDLPGVLAHELLGHGLWAKRAHRVNAAQAIHHHELYEINARLVGWIVEFELNAHGPEWHSVRAYLENPLAFAAALKLQIPYYALTFSTADMARPTETLEARAGHARARKEELGIALSNHCSWYGVIDHFVHRHDVPEQRMASLRTEMAVGEAECRRDLKVIDDVIAELDATIARLHAEADQATEKYLLWATTLPLVGALQRDVDVNDRRLRDIFAERSIAVGPTERAPEQITFDELVTMFREDRGENPDHWRGRS